VSCGGVNSAVEWEAEREALRLEIEQQRAAVDEATGELSGMVEVNLQLQEEVAGLKRRAEAAEARESKLESELTKLAGQHNVAQRIHHMQKVKEENALLRAEVVQVREELRRVQHRCQLLLEPQGNHSSVAGGNGRPASTDRQRPGNGSRRTPIVWQPPAVTSSSAEEALGSAEE
jgi:seryl-tRNA synthetase